MGVYTMMRIRWRYGYLVTGSVRKIVGVAAMSAALCVSANGAGAQTMMAGMNGVNAGISGPGGSTGYVTDPAQAKMLRDAANAYKSPIVPLVDTIGFEEVPFRPGMGSFRPYVIARRPSSGYARSQEPVRRTTFSLGYVSSGGFGNYFY